MGRRIPVPSMCCRHRRAPVVLIRLSQTETNAQGQSTTTVWRAIRANKEDRVAKLEWAPGGGLGRAVIGKVRPSLRQTFHSTSFLTLPSDHRTTSLWPTWSAETPGCPCVFWSLSRFHGPSDMGETKNSRVFNGPDGFQYRWRPSTTNQDIVVGPT